MKKCSVAVALLAASAPLWSCRTEAPHVTPGARGGTPSGIGRSWDICALVGQQHERPGFYGTDLGISVPLANSSADAPQLAMLFGDSWAAQTDVCAYPVAPADDLQAVIPATRPAPLTLGQPTAEAADACGALTYALEDPADPTSWPRIHLYRDAVNRSSDNQLQTGMLRTPVAGWSDGQHTFGVFVRDEATRCHASTECPAQMVCSTDPSYGGKKVGGCQPDVSLTEDADPTFCVTDGDCPTLSFCSELNTGVCLMPAPFNVQRDGQAISPPSWYDDDPRRAIARNLYLATALWPDRPEDYGTGFKFATNKFLNPTIRTIARFDPENPDNNDYTAGTDTLLMWGRSSFISTQGNQAFPYLLYQPLAGLLDAQGNLHWAPHFFAGYGEDGNPRWSEIEADAIPVYGIDENLVDDGGHPHWRWAQPEVDYVEQMSVAWIAPLSRWVMLYSGDSPAFATSDPKSGDKLAPAHAQTVPGAVHLRSAAHPWGKARADSDSQQAFSEARPVLTHAMMAKYLACDDDAKDHRECTPQPQTRGAGDLIGTLAGWTTQLAPGDWASVTTSCLAGDTLLGIQNSLNDDSGGHLYGANIIEQWTDDVTARVPDLAAGQSAVELYWNVSTWNPYSVILVKTELRGSADGLL